MKELSEITVCCVDHGLFFQMARRMAEACKRVILWNPDSRAFPSIKQECIGDGFENVERVREFWPHFDEIDLFCFPDSRLAGLQTYLVSQGKPVWGSRYGENFEQRREFFMKTLAKLGLDVAPYTVVHGLDELRSFLRDKEDQYIKISYLRGDMETTHWRNWKMDEGWLDWLAVNLGPFKRHIRFLMFPAINTPLEIGGDTHIIDGQAPTIMLNGIEGKDKSYFAAVTPRNEMPEQIQKILDAFESKLRSVRYRNQISFEVRVKDNKSYFNDFTGRGGMPSTASQHLLWKNFPLMVWAGANGEMVDPEPAARYSIETMITSKAGKDCFDVVELPKELEPWARFSNCAFVDGCYVFPPDELMANDLGWLCAIGDTPTETLAESKRLADLLPDALNSDVESLAAVIQEIETAEKQGIEFGDDKMPKPAEVLD